MRNEDKDYFSLVWDLIIAMERKDYVVASAPDCPTDDKTVFILPDLGFSAPDDRYVLPAELVATLFMKHMTREERQQIPARFAFATTHFEGGIAFFFKAPDDKVFDFAAIKKDFNNIREMFRPMSLAEINLGKFRDNPHQICLGPFGEVDLPVFGALAGSVAGFHGVTAVRPHMARTDIGAYLIFEKHQYAQILKNTEMLMSCAVYRGEVTLPAATHALQ